jgi:DNA-binding XRE family transcriptional regulator
MRTPSPIRTLIREARKARGMTLAQVAKGLGTTPQSIQRIETGNMTCSLEWLYAIADVLEIKPHLLLVPIDSLPVEEQFIEAMRAALMRNRRDAPELTLAHLIEAQGTLASLLLDYEAGHRSYEDVTRWAATVAAIAMRIGVDGKKRAGAAPKLEAVA